MALTFQVMNRNDANRYCYKAHQATTAIISISSWYDEQVRLFQTPQNNIKSIFRVTFNDVGADGVGHMTEEDAAKIADYALKNKKFAKIVGTKNCTVNINGTSKNLTNTNELLGNLNRCIWRKNWLYKWSQ